MNKLDSIKALILKLKEIEEYLNLVTEGKYPLNNQIIFNLQVQITLYNIYRKYSITCQI